MSSLLKDAIIRTLCYADIFDYPLTKDEIWKWMIGFRIQNSEFRKIKKEKYLREKKGLFFLTNREYIINVREKREKFSKRRILIASQIASFLKIIPTVKLIGITGALAVENTKVDDDIDLLIVTSKNLLWTTRFIVTIFVELLGRRRRPNEICVNNKICLNMYIDEDHLEVEEKEKDLFGAHEVLQMKPLFVRENTYQKFLQRNTWVKKYLPNIYEELTLSKSEKDTSEVAKQRLRLFRCLPAQAGWRNRINIFWLIEDLLKKFQLWYMRNHRTTEKISDGIIRFHPLDVRKMVMKKYIENTEKYK